MVRLMCALVWAGQTSGNVTIAAEENTAAAQDDALAVNLKDAKK